MRLLKIGRDNSCDITLSSIKVSALHAEITILNNGDMLLEDKGSTNGTFIMNKPIQPGVQVPIKKGDAIRFGDTELQWIWIPELEDISQYKGVYGIGKNFHNDIRIDGNTVSRFHATLKIEKNNKAYIQDHSKNGTTVNGNKILFGENKRIKRGNAVVCGGVPVKQRDIDQYIPKPVWPKIAAAISAVAAIICILLLLPASTPSIKSLQRATAYVQSNFYIVVTINDDPFKEMFKSWPKEWLFGRVKEEYPVPKTFAYEDQATPITFGGTAFFISKKGELGTNRHIAAPWEYLDDFKPGTKETITQFIAELRQALLPINEIGPYTDLEAIKDTKLGYPIYEYIEELKRNNSYTKAKLIQINSWINRFKNSTITISGRMTNMSIALSGQNFTSSNEFLPCHVVAETGDDKRDIALLRLNSKKTPEQIIKDGFFDIAKARLDETELQPQSEDLITMGYPWGLILGLFTENNSLKPTVHKISISKEPDEFKFQFQGEELSGASGSPIIDSKRHQLVGVLYGGYTVGSSFGLACNIKHLKELYDKNKAKDE